MLEAALKLAERWAIFPCKPGEKVPATPHGCKDATRDPDQIRSWWTANPNFNIGIATGPISGIWVLDVDGEPGEETLISYGFEIPRTLIQTTPSGGFHLIFSYTGNLGNTARKLGPGLDTRGAGGYILAAPSKTPVGEYRWAQELSPTLIPGWLLRIVNPKPEPVTPRTIPVRESSSKPERYALAALKSECDDLAAMPPKSGRNHQLNRAAFNLGGFVTAGLLNSQTVYADLMSAAAACGLLGEDGERTCRSTIQSGLTAGLKNPRVVA